MKNAPLKSHYALSTETINGFKQNGHCVVRNLASHDEITTYKNAIDEATMERRWDKRPIEERDTYGKAFIQSAALCNHSDKVKEFVFAQRFARVAAELLGVDGVRLYHDQALYKEPGGGFTPWHQDQVYWPLNTDRTITMWMPTIDVPSEIGGVVFANESWRDGNLGEEVIGDASQAFFDTLIDERGYSLESHGPFAAGDATFHLGWTLHSAPSNNTDVMRSVMTIIYYADGTTVGETNHPARDLDLALWLGNAKPGSPADSAANPLLWHRSWND